SRDPRHLHSFPTRRSSDLVLPWLWLLRLFWFYRFFLFFYRRVLLTLIWPLSFRWRSWIRLLFIWRSFFVLWRSLAISIVFAIIRSEEHTSELQSRENLVCR